ncbi:MAG TPA: hypothetical protein VKT29_15520 [Terriglobales bacterium]|nr:hypothetical protein [Terriglobales bacterium]
MRRHRILRVLMFLPLVILFVALFGWVVMSLWNWLMPAVFGWKVISYWQALGLFILCKILFGGFRGSGGGRRWRHRLRERWEQMTPEEREKFREGLGGRWGCAPAAESKP